MFVHVGKLVELPEGVRRERIPSVVRLQPFDDCLRVWVDAPDSLSAGARTHSLGAKDGKLRVSDELGRKRVAMAGDDEIIDEIVEGGGGGWRQSPMMRRSSAGIGWVNLMYTYCLPLSRSV